MADDNNTSTLVHFQLDEVDENEGKAIRHKGCFS